VWSGRRRRPAMVGRSPPGGKRFGAKWCRSTCRWLAMPIAARAGEGWSRLSDSNRRPLADKVKPAQRRTDLHLRTTPTSESPPGGLPSTDQASTPYRAPEPPSGTASRGLGMLGDRSTGSRRPAAGHRGHGLRGGLLGARLAGPSHPRRQHTPGAGVCGWLISHSAGSGGRYGGGLLWRLGVAWVSRRRSRWRGRRVGAEFDRG
jgi:hypothetical protein